jgi:hypothetical protein
MNKLNAPIMLILEVVEYGGVEDENGENGVATP